MNKYFYISFISACSVFMFILFIIIQNNFISTTFYSLTISSNPVSVLRIVHLSDLHGKEFGRGNHRLIKKVRSLDPDIIVITGDWIDENTINIEGSVIALKEMEKIAPVFYIPGNHEYWSDKMTILKDTLSDYKSRIIQNEMVNLQMKGFEIVILGLDEVMIPSGGPYNAPHR